MRKKNICDSIPSTEILLILRYQYITRQIKQYLTCKHDIFQTCDCKEGHIKMTSIIKIGFIFDVQLAYPVNIEINGWQESVTQKPYKILW